MNTENFRHRAISWLRDDMNVNTECLPHEAIEDDAGNALLDAEIVRAPRGNPYFKQALVALGLSYACGLAGNHPLGSSVELALQLMTGAFAVMAVGYMIAAAVRRRGRRRPLVIELRPCVRRRARVELLVLEALRREADGIEAWIVAEAGFTPEALAAAGGLGVRCFALVDDRFVEAKPTLTALVPALAA